MEFRRKLAVQQFNRSKFNGKCVGAVDSYFDWIELVHNGYRNVVFYQRVRQSDLELLNCGTVEHSSATLDTVFSV